jgi:hypothetical protein
MKGYTSGPDATYLMKFSRGLSQLTGSVRLVGESRVTAGIDNNVVVENPDPSPTPPEPPPPPPLAIPDATQILNGSKYFYSFHSGQIRYFWFNETSDKGLGNNNSLLIDMADMAQYDGNHSVDMIVRYGGPGGDGIYPTIDDWRRLVDLWQRGKYNINENYPFFMSHSRTSFETIWVYNDGTGRKNPEGYYYIMLYNPGGYAPEIRIGYSDADSVLYPTY